MKYIKRYGILLEKPYLSFSKFEVMLQTIMKANLIPIIIFQDGYENNNSINLYNKIDIFRNKYPHLRDDNFLKMDANYNIKTNRNEWKTKLKEVVSSINNKAFGFSDDTVNDKLFITNICNIAIVNRNLILISDEIDGVLADLLNIADVSNIKSLSDEVFDPYFNMLIKDRDFDVIEYDNTKGNEFYSKIKAVPGSKAYIRMEDPKYIEVINKYNLGSLLYGTYRKNLSIKDKDLDNVIKFLSNSSLTYQFDNTNKTINIPNGLIKIEQ